MKWTKSKDSNTHTFLGQKFSYAYNTELKLFMIKSHSENDLMIAIPIENLKTAKEISKLIEK